VKGKSLPGNTEKAAKPGIGEGSHVHDSGACGGGDGAPTGEPGGVDPAFLALERELAVFLRRARASSGEMARELHPDLEPGAYGLLVRLADAGEQRATALAAYFGVGKATMSRQLRALEALRLVTRRPDPADGRASLIVLTDEGRTRFTAVRDARRHRYMRTLESWARSEIAELARLLSRLNEAGAEQDEGCPKRPGGD
jgi:DNA-binding MarR family transcriptional regulator